MPRIKLVLPDLPFSTRITVRITDLNYGNHLGNDSILSIIHEARVRFLKHHGLGELEFEGVSLIMGDAAIEFRGEAFYGNILQVEAGATEFSPAGFTIFYRIGVADTGRIIALARTGMVCFDYESRKVARMPANALRLLSGQSL